MTQYERPEEQILTPQEMYRMTKKERQWDYLQGKFKIDLEVLINTLMEADKAGKATWTDVELFRLLFTLRDAQERITQDDILGSE